MNATVHVVSASTVYGPDRSGPFHSLAMCGVDLGTYREATAAGHVVGNYASETTLRALVTCPVCLERTIR